MLRPLIGTGLIVVATGLGPAAWAADNAGEARAAVKAMAEFLAAQPALAVDFDSSIEIVTPDLEKFQFNSTGRLAVVRPDRIRLERRGGFADVAASFDGKTLTILDKDNNRYAEVDVAGTLDALMDRMPAEHGMAIPASDLLRSEPQSELMNSVTAAVHVGGAVIGGVDTEYYAFRTPTVDWQVWVADGDQPVPMKFVVTTKTVAQAPQYTIQFRDWTFGDAAGARVTDLDIGDATKVDLIDLANLDELPTEGEAQ